jgi:hypothetical protein
MRGPRCVKGRLLVWAWRHDARAVSHRLSTGAYYGSATHRLGGAPARRGSRADRCADRGSPRSVGASGIHVFAAVDRWPRSAASSRSPSGTCCGRSGAPGLRRMTPRRRLSRRSRADGTTARPRPALVPSATSRCLGHQAAASPCPTAALGGVSARRSSASCRSGTPARATAAGAARRAPRAPARRAHRAPGSGRAARGSPPGYPAARRRSRAPR